MSEAESRGGMNGLTIALDSASDICFRANKRSVAAPSPDYRHTTSFCQKRICEKLLTVPLNKVKKEFCVVTKDNKCCIIIVVVGSCFGMSYKREQYVLQLRFSCPLCNGGR